VRKEKQARNMVISCLMNMFFYVSELPHSHIHAAPATSIYAIARQEHRTHFMGFGASIVVIGAGGIGEKETSCLN
jgi:hypothetical protein